MIFNANSFVRYFKSPFVLPFSAFMIPPFSAFRFHPSSFTSPILPRFGNSRNVEMSVWLAVRLVYFGSGIPSWRQIFRANRSAISVWRGTVVTRRGSARFTYLLCLAPSSARRQSNRSKWPDQLPPFHLHLEL